LGDEQCEGFFEERADGEAVLLEFVCINVLVGEGEFCTE